MEKASKDCWYFLTEFCYTWYPDPNHKYSVENPVGRSIVDKFPQKMHLKRSLARILRERKILIKKSRQLSYTWLLVGYCLWCAAFNKNLEVIFQSDTEEKVKDPLFKRFDFIYDHLDPLMKSRIGEIKSMELSRTFLKSKSKIFGVASGASKISSHNPNIIFSDQMGEQMWQKETIAGSLPAINNGGQFIGVSTIKPNAYFNSMCSDTSKRMV